MSGSRERIIGAVVALLVVGACSDSEAFDRDGAVTAVAEANGWTAKEAACWVDRVHDELGEDAIAAGAAGEVTAEATLAITVDCVDPAKLTERSGIPTITPRPGEPQSYGDDAALDALWDGCAAGDDVACDQLFDAAPLGSEYERFGSTCGDRGFRPRCGEG